MPVEVKGAIELRKAIKKFSPDLAVETRKELANLLAPIVRNARGFIPSQVPISGWGKASGDGNFPLWNSGQAKRGIGYKTTPSKPNRQGFRAVARIVNASAAGAIYETMGRKTPSSKFVQNQNNKYAGEFKGQNKDRGRVLFRAYDEDKGAARDGVLRAIEKANRDFKKATA